MQDQDFISRLQMGDDQAFKHLFDQFAEKIFNVCLRFLGSRHEAEDGVQEVFCKIYFSIKQFREEAQLSSWIYRIAVNYCLNIQRQKKRTKLFSLDWFSERESDFVLMKNDNPQDVIEKKETEKIIQDAIDSLSSHQRSALILYRYEQLSYQEIAQILNCSVAAVESRLHQAKQNLSKKLIAIFKE